jgi:dTDP-glucose 4,6-dehydratase
MKLLVTGGAGFIGSNFVRRTIEDAYPGLAGADVVVLDALTYSGNLENLSPVADSPRYTFVEGDIRDAPLLDRLLGDVDAIVHFAAESHVDRSVLDASAFVETNVLGTQRLLDAALRAKTPRFVHVSTDEVYGSIEEGSWDELQPLEPNSPYSASKAGSDLHHALLEQLRAVPLSRKIDSAVCHQSDRRRPRSAVRRGQQCAGLAAR